MQDHKTHDFLENVLFPAEVLARREAIMKKIIDRVPLREDLQEKSK